MATDGTPEAAARRCGEAIARLRTSRRWSRAQLVLRLYDELTPDDPNADSVSETWLARLENGRMVKVPRQTIEALCRALCCTPQERAWVLLSADRNVLAEDIGAPSPVAELLTYAVERLYDEAGETLGTLLGRRDPATLDELELYELLAAAAHAALARSQSAPSTRGAAAPTRLPRRPERIARVPRSAASGAAAR